MSASAQLLTVLRGDIGPMGSNDGCVSFDWSSDTPVYVYANRLSDVASYIAEAASHAKSGARPAPFTSIFAKIGKVTS